MTIKIEVSDSLVLNTLIHILILFIFLYIFFFFYISGAEEKITNTQVTNLAKNNVPTVLKFVDDYDTKKKIDWDIVKKKAEKVINDPSNDSKSRADKNNNLKIVGGVIIVSLAILPYFVYIHYGSPNISQILAENAVVFGFIGIVEYIFFTNTASHYVPVYPDVIGSTILERIKTKISSI